MSAGVKKSMLRSVGGKDIMGLLDHMGKVLDNDTFDQMVDNI